MGNNISIVLNLPESKGDIDSKLKKEKEKEAKPKVDKGKGDMTTIKRLLSNLNRGVDNLPHVVHAGGG